MPTQLQAVLVLLGATAIVVILSCVRAAHRTAPTTVPQARARRDYEELSLNNALVAPGQGWDPALAPPPKTGRTALTVSPTRPEEPTPRPSQPPTTPTRAPDGWKSEVVFKGYVYNFKRVCIRRNRLMFFGKEFPHRNDSQKTIGWMFVDSYLNDFPVNLTDSPRVTVYKDPTLLIAGASTGPKSNPTHALFNIFGSFSIGMSANNTPGAPFAQVFYHFPGRTPLPTEKVWDGAFAQELGLLTEDAVMLTQPSRGTTACFENLVASRIVQDANESRVHRGKWYRDMHHRLVDHRPPPTKKCEMVIMDRTEMPTRRWTNAAPLVAKLRARYPSATIHFFNAANPLANLTPREQFALFANASVFLGPHGGVEGNFIFMRPQSLITTMCCAYVAWAYSHGVMDALKHDWHIWAAHFRENHLGFSPAQRTNATREETKYHHDVETLACHEPSGANALVRKNALQQDFEAVAIDDLVEVVGSISSGPCTSLA